MFTSSFLIERERSESVKQQGILQEIMRFPVKSMRGESLSVAEVDTGGLYGDRSHAYYNEARPGKFLSGLDYPKFVEYQAAYVGAALENGYPSVEVISPAGRVYRWGDEALDREIAGDGRFQLRPHRFEPGEIGGSWEAAILLTTDASQRAIEHTRGAGEIDGRRYRGNLLIALDEDVPFVEETWLGRQVQIGEVILRVDTLCDRCDIINIDPDRAVHDRSVLKAVAKRNSANFGVRCSVVKTGVVRIGDPLLLL